MSLFKKIFKKEKESETVQPKKPERVRTMMEIPQVEEEDIQYEFDNVPQVELSSIAKEPVAKPETIGELDIFINSRKIETRQIGSPSRIGRDPARAEVVIPELIVSKLHCTIYHKDGKIFLQDNTSTNGTYISGHKVDVQPIENGTTINLGRRGTVQLVFRSLI